MLRQPCSLRWLLACGLTLPAMSAQQALPPPPEQAQWSRYLCVGLVDGSVLVYTWWDVQPPPSTGRAGAHSRAVSGNAWCFTPTHALIGQQIRSVPLDSVRYAMTDTPERLPGVPTLQPTNHSALGTGLTVLGVAWLVLVIVLYLAIISAISSLAGVGF